MAAGGLGAQLPRRAASRAPAPAHLSPPTAHLIQNSGWSRMMSASTAAPMKTMCRRRGGSSTFTRSRRSPSRSPRSTLRRDRRDGHPTNSSCWCGCCWGAAGPRIQRGFSWASWTDTPRPPCCNPTTLYHTLCPLPCLSRYSPLSSFSILLAMPGYIVLPPLRAEKSRAEQRGGGGGAARGQHSRGARAPPSRVRRRVRAEWCAAAQHSSVQGEPPHLSTILEYRLRRLSISLSCRCVRESEGWG